MKLLRMFILTVSFFSLTSIAQDVPVDELPVATIASNYYITLPEIPVENYYYVDISHLVFENEAQAVYLLRAYCQGNLITCKVFYPEHYMIIRIHTEYLPDGEVDRARLQTYLGHLPKPPAE
jgi:hypothetical protein